MKPSEPTPVKLLCGVLFSDEPLLKKALSLLAEKYGEIDFIGKRYLFESTDYYSAEMGGPIYRVFYTFTQLINPGRLAKIKIECNEIEDLVAVQQRRKINLDPGYMDYDKVVLASAKYNSHKIYLDHGIYADPTLHYIKGRYLPGEYCFPDFKNGLYEKEFLEIRTIYKTQLKNSQ